MREITYEELLFAYPHFLGWDYSGGRSMNVWIRVLTENLPIDLINEAISKGEKSCIWTCYDNIIYRNIDENGRVKPVSLEDLPKYISATFKPTYSKYAALAENLGMKIAVALGLPTSYNYIVKFDPTKHKEITDHLNQRDLDKLQPYGIVSIDFLKPADINNHSQAYSGDRLITFEETLHLSAYSPTRAYSDEPYLIKSWINGLKEFITEKRQNSSLSKHEQEKQLKNIESRIVRSYLLREFLGDCDFTGLNSGLVHNSEEKKLSFAPNFDYGECFNTLIKTKLDYLPPKKELETILKWDPNYLKKKEMQRNTPIAELARKFSSSTSEQNLRFIMENYKEDTKEFLTSLQNAMNEGKLLNIIDGYTVGEDALLTKDEGEVFKYYLLERAAFFTNFLQHQLPKEKF